MVYIEDFQSFVEGGLAGQGSWIASIRNLNVVDIAGDKRINDIQSGVCACLLNEPVNDNHYAQCVIDAMPVGYAGVAVRGDTSGNLYYLIVGPSLAILGKLVSGSFMALKTGVVTVSIGDTIRLEIEGTKLSPYINGILISSIGEITDTSYSTGKPGLVSSGPDSINIDDFEAGDIGLSTDILTASNIETGQFIINNAVMSWLPEKELILETPVTMELILHAAITTELVLETPVKMELILETPI